MNGPAPIEWPDIDAFARQSQAYLPWWSIPLIEDIDEIYLQVRYSAASDDQQQALKDGMAKVSKQGLKRQQK